jgi:hypothetical protein
MQTVIPEPKEMKELHKEWFEMRTALTEREQRDYLFPQKT